MQPLQQHWLPRCHASFCQTKALVGGAATLPRALNPTYASWLNQAEYWFNIIAQRAIRRGTSRSVKELVERIDDFVTRYNRRAAPFMWTAKADSILEKIKRLYERTSGTRYYSPAPCCSSGYNYFFARLILRRLSGSQILAPKAQEPP